jgi:tetratricopeptide (TPR) repeat protein
MLTRAEQARDIHKFFQTPPRAQLGLLQVLLAIYHRTGKGDAARALLDELLREPDYWDTDRGPIERAELLLRGGWVLREQGRGDEALERVDRLLFESPGVHRPQAVFLYVERARAQAALGRPDEAQKDLDAFLKASPRGAGSYEHYAAACLLRGVLCQRRGDADGARAAWREGLYRRWPGDKDASGKPLPVTWTSTDALLYGVILAALCDDLSPEELVAIGKRFVSAAARQSTELPSLSDIPLPTRCLSTMWRTPRGQQCVAHISLQDLPAGDYCRLPLVLFSYEYVRNEAFAGELSAAQDALLWQAGNDLFDAYIARAVEIPQLVNLGLAWRGSTGIFGWAGVKNSLKPALRGPVAYLMGQRYLRLGKPAEAAQFFRSARDLAESGSELARLAQAELDGLERK